MNKMYLKRALEKRDRIIAREGDGNGIMLTDDYLTLLVDEEQQKEVASVVFDGLLCSCKKEKYNMR